jgi:hypothetical protein
VAIVEVAPEPDSDVPLFAPAPSDDDNAVVSDVEVLPDSDGKDEAARPPTA